MEESPFLAKPRICFEVEKVIGISSEGNIRSYHVQWAPAWVSGFHLVGCEHLINEFLHAQQQLSGAENTLHCTHHDLYTVGDSSKNQYSHHQQKQQSQHSQLDYLDEGPQVVQPVSNFLHLKQDDACNESVVTPDEYVNIKIEDVQNPEESLDSDMPSQDESTYSNSSAQSSIDHLQHCNNSNNNNAPVELVAYETEEYSESFQQEYFVSDNEKMTGRTEKRRRGQEIKHPMLNICPETGKVCRTEESPTSSGCLSTCHKSCGTNFPLCVREKIHKFYWSMEYSKRSAWLAGQIISRKPKRARVRNETRMRARNRANTYSLPNNGVEIEVFSP